MTEHCDSEEQVSVASTEGTLRPDMLIRLPESKIIVVDSKSAAQFLYAFETENDEERKQLLAHSMRRLCAITSATSAPKHIGASLMNRLTMLYCDMQIESSFGAALAADPTLIEDGIRNKVVFATPTTLITLLRTVGFVWQQVRITESS